jgi:hypothetical protein
MKRPVLRTLAAIGSSLAAAGFGITILAYFKDESRATSWGFYPAFVLRHTTGFYTPYLLATALFLSVMYLLFSYAASNSSTRRSASRAAVDEILESLATASAASIGFCIAAIGTQVTAEHRLMRKLGVANATWDPQSVWKLLTSSGLFLVVVFLVFCTGFYWRYTCVERSHAK